MRRSSWWAAWRCRCTLHGTSANQHMSQQSKPLSLNSVSTSTLSRSSLSAPSGPNPNCFLTSSVEALPSKFLLLFVSATMSVFTEKKFFIWIYNFYFRSQLVRNRWGVLMRSGEARKKFPNNSVNNVITLATRVRIQLLKVNVCFRFNFDFNFSWRVWC